MSEEIAPGEVASGTKGGSRPHKSEKRKGGPENMKDPGRLALLEAKRKLGEAVAGKGADHIVKIVEDGPGITEESAKLWQFAMNFAADRGGLPRVASVDIEGTAIPPLEVRLKGFTRPSDT